MLDGSVSFPTDLGELDRHVRETEARAVLIDPVSASIDLKLDAHKDQDVRVVLGQLAHLAERERLAVVMNAHLNKAPSADPYLRINGSTAFYNAARSVLTVTRDPEEPDWHRLVAHHKSNYGPLAPVERWRVVPKTVATDGGPIEVMTMEFVEIADDVSREDVLAAGTGRHREARRGGRVPRGRARRRRLARLGRARGRSPARSGSRSGRCDARRSRSSRSSTSGADSRRRPGGGSPVMPTPLPEPWHDWTDRMDTGVAASPSPVMPTIREVGTTARIRACGSPVTAPGAACECEPPAFPGEVLEERLIVVTWRPFAERELPRAIRELEIPCATHPHTSGRSRCPRHGTRIGPITGICLDCHTQAWDEVGRRYAAQSRPVAPERSVSAFPGPNRKPLPGQLPLFEDDNHRRGGDHEHQHRARRTRAQHRAGHDPKRPITMFGSDPNVAVRKMGEIAVALMDVVRDRKLSVKISGGEYLTAEAWTLLGGLTGVTPVVAWTRPLEDGSGWEARVEARTLDERVIGAAESMCTRAEAKWARRDEFQLRSMAQTRAIARALRAPLAPIVALSEYEASVAEEIADIVIDAPASKIEGKIHPTRSSRLTTRSPSCASYWPSSPPHSPMSTGQPRPGRSPVCRATC